MDNKKLTVNPELKALIQFTQQKAKENGFDSAFVITKLQKDYSSKETIVFKGTNHIASNMSMAECLLATIIKEHNEFIDRIISGLKARLRSRNDLSSFSSNSKILQ